MLMYLSTIQSNGYKDIDMHHTELEVGGNPHLLGRALKIKENFLNKVFLDLGLKEKSYLVPKSQASL